MIKGALGIAKLSDVALNASFTEAVQRDCSGDSMLEAVHTDLVSPSA